MSVSGRSTPTLAAPGTGSSNSNNGSTVRVVLRIRPPPPPEASVHIPPRFQRSVLAPLPGSQTTLSVDTLPTTASGAPAVSPASSSKANQKQHFSFDRVFAPQDGQSSLYTVAEDLVGKFTEGFNVTVLAYGQTSSGKSYTTDHTDVQTDGQDRLGIIPRAVSEIFDRLDRRCKAEPNAFSYVMKNSYIELYNEDLIDLMATDSYDRPQVSIREDKQGNIIWMGLKEARVSSASEVMSNLDLGSAVRQTSATDMNAQSSRSHAIFSLTLTQRKWAGSGPPPSRAAAASSGGSNRMSRIGLPRGASPAPGSRPMSPAERPGSRYGIRPPSVLGNSGRASPGPNTSLDEGVDMARSDSNEQWVTVTSKFHFVDLAGSERLKRTAAVGERVKEGISINSGLHALGNVISALGDPQKARNTTHIPYRDSKLTRLLQDSLGGNAWTLFVACVSPTEYNLNETINTLKYANRARNIKNQALVSEVEVGWDDLEHVQNLVVKLRAELNTLKSGGAASSSMNTISEEPSSPIRGSAAATPAMLELQDKFADLSQKYAKLTAELARGGGASSHGGRSPGASLSPEDFAAAVEPVVEEYEKSLSALESQLSLTKAALSFAEEEMKQQEMSFNDTKRQAEEEIADLTARIAKLAQRESSTEDYIRDLEAKIKTSDEGDSDLQAQLAELRKELAKYKETEANSDAYIKELETRMADSDEAVASLRKQVERAEQEMEKKDKLLVDLQSRLAQLDAGSQRRALVQELKEQDEKLTELERQLHESIHSGQESKAALRQLQEQLDSETQQREEIQKQLGDLDSTAPRPQTPEVAGAPRDTNRLSVLKAHATLQERYDQTLTELESVNNKYRRALQQVHSLTQQLEDEKVEEIDDSPQSSLNGGSQPPSRSPGDSARDLDRPSLLNLNGQTSPSNTRRSLPIGVVSPTMRGSSFLGKGGLRTSSSFSHLRSASLSQEPVRQLSPAQRPPVYSLTHRRAQSSASSLPTAHPLMPSPGLARSPSPNPSLSESLMEGGPSRERTYDSLLKEVSQLQHVLNTREDEIRALESTLREQSSRKTSLASLGAEDGNPMVALHANPEPSQPSSAASSQLSPQSEEMLKTLKTELGLDSYQETPTAGVRVDDLMRSMAKKEAAHRHAVEDLTRTLESLRKQHLELEQLSRDQVVNMSQEIEGLRHQLITSHNDYEASIKKVTALEAELASAVSANEALQAEQRNSATARDALQQEYAEVLAAKDKEHSESVAQLQDEHSTFLGQMIEERQAIFVERAKEHDSALRLVRTESEAAIDKAKQGHIEALATAEERIASLESERAALEQSLTDMAAREADSQDKKDLFESLHKQHEEALRRRDEEHSALVDRLKQDHRQAVQALDQTGHTRSQHVQEEHDIAISNLIESQNMKMDESKREQEARLAASQAKHQAAIAEKEQSLDKLSAAHEEALSSLETELEMAHSQQLKELTQTHEAQLQAATEMNQELSRKAQSDSENELATAQTQHQNELTAKDQALKELQAKLATEKASSETSTAQLAEANAKGHTLGQELAALQQRLFESEHERERSQQAQASESAERLRQYAADLEAMKQERVKLDDELAALRSSSQDMDTRLKNALAEGEELRNTQAANGNQDGELQDALVALETLEKALVDSQEEREQLLVQIEELRETGDGTTQAEKSLADTQKLLQSTQADLESSNKEREELKASQAKLSTMVKELQAKVALSGKRSPELAGSAPEMSGDESSDHRASLNGYGPGSMSAARSQAMASKSPPTVPPPSMSLPPLPTSLPALPAGVSAPHSTSSTSGTAADRSSNSQNVSRSSTTTTTGGPGSRSSTTSIATVDVNLDPRIQKRMEDQDANIVALNKQLAHCESDLRANMQLVSTLESALNEAERNLRKSRMQLNEYAKDRDGHAKTCDSLRQQLQAAFSDMEALRENLAKAKKDGDSRLAAERQQRDAARVQLEARMNEMRERKSKLNCF